MWLLLLIVPCHNLLHLLKKMRMPSAEMLNYKTLNRLLKHAS
jgi:hypothetical protein